MPAPTSTTNSVDWLVKIAGNAVGGSTGGTLTLNRTAEDTTSDEDARSKSSVAGTSSWSLGFDSFHKLGGQKLNGSGVTVTVGGVALKGITETALALTCGVGDVVNSTTGLARTLDPQTRSGSLTVSADYYDPLATGGAGYASVLDEIAGVTSAGLAIVVTLGGMSFSFTGRPTTTTLTKSLPELLKAGITFEATGPITPVAGTSDTGVVALITAMLATPASTPVVVLVGPAAVGATEFTGSGYVSSLTVTIPIATPVKVSGTIEGSGTLTRRAKTA